MKHPLKMMPLLAMTLLMASPSVWATPDALRAKVERALSARHRPPTARQLLQYGLDVDVVLREIVEEPRGNRLARNRALTTLRHFPGMETRALLEHVLDETSREKRGLAMLDLGQALRSYAMIVGPKSLARVQPLLKHQVLEVRLAAASALRLSKHRDAQALIRSRLTLETSTTGRAELKKQLVILDRAAKTK
ncbi:MAG: hypothetical protein JRH20_23455 [Deltaproteobacteria bacterium]|nr:hypothetical protein [Deltaproteobacteria bacterium]